MIIIILFYLLHKSSSYLIAPVCDPGLGDVSAIPKVLVGAVWSFCTFREEVVHCLFWVTAWALAAGPQFPLVEGTGCSSNLDSSSVKRYPLFPCKVSSYRQLFSWELDGLIWCDIKFVPDLKTTACCVVWVEAFYSSKALP